VKILFIRRKTKNPVKNGFAYGEPSATGFLVAKI